MSLRQRLILSITLALVAALAFGSALAFWHAAHQVRTEMQAAMAVSEHIVKNAIEDTKQTDRHRDLERLIAEFNGNRHLRAVLVDESGKELSASSPELPDTRAPDWFNRALTGTPQQTKVELPPDGPDHYSVILTTDASNELAEAWSDINLSLTVLAIFSTLVLGLIYLTLERGLRPLKELNAAFVRIGAADYAARVTETGATEFVDLGRNFNRMASRLGAMKLQNDRLNEQLESVQEEERADLARELHDEIGPFLFAVSLDVSAICQFTKDSAELTPRVEAIREAITHMQRHLRSILGRLRSTVLLDFGLAHAADGLVDFWKVRHPKVDFGIDISQESYGEVLDGAIYRILREGLSNALRHGQPDRVQISVTQQGEGTLSVTIVDDGRGMDHPSESVAGFGIIGMRERAASLGGSVLVKNRAEARGVILTAQFPFDPVSSVVTKDKVSEFLQ
jgi:two-component system, NarL family, sensor histidine kinase UhpB